MIMLEFVYTGHSGSRVFGSIINGVFSGTIYLQNDTFYVEKSELYFLDAPFHSIMYSDRDVEVHPNLRYISTYLVTTFIIGISMF